MKSKTQNTSCAIIGAGLLLMAFVLHLGAANLDSGWSAATNKLRLRTLCPTNLIAGGQGKLFWVKCEIRNDGKTGLWVTNRARFFLVDHAGNTHRCLRRMARSKKDGVAAFNYVRFLNAGQTHSFWESGELVTGGDYSLHAVLDGVGVQTPPVQVNIKFSESADAEATRVAALQKRFDGFPAFEPNQGGSEGTYRWVGFTNDPVVVDGELYYGFRFKSPESRRRLDWSFVRDLNMTSARWYIVARHGDMQGFRNIDRTIYGREGVPGLTRADDVTIYQTLSPARFKPGEEYLMWFSPQHGLPHGVMVSLNFPTLEAVGYRATPEAIQELDGQESVKAGP